MTNHTNISTCTPDDGKYQGELAGSLTLNGVLMTMHAPTLLNQQVAALLREHLGDVVVEPPIRRNIRLAEATSRGEPIHVHAPNSNGGQDHQAVAQALSSRWGLSRRREA